jgi:hypothetical protein
VAVAAAVRSCSGVSTLRGRPSLCASLLYRSTASRSVDTVPRLVRFPPW